MSILILVLVVIFLFTLSSGIAVWLVFYIRRLPQDKKTVKEAGEAKRLPFRWSYFILPVAILIVSIILAAFFYPQLPAEVAYHFQPDGSPDKWLSPEAILTWMLVPQLCLTLIAGAIAWGMTRASAVFTLARDELKMGKIISLMSNMIGLPQIILGFAMLDIFSYNSYGIHLLPIWLFALIILGLGSIPLGIFFIQAIRQVMTSSTVQPNKGSRSNNNA